MRRPRSLGDFVVIAAALSVGFSVGIPLYVADRITQDRRADACAARQELWLGEVDVVRLIGAELGATEARIEVAVDHFSEAHPRPDCKELPTP